jgi:hypothetical protein
MASVQVDYDERNLLRSSQFLTYCVFMKTFDEVIAIQLPMPAEGAVPDEVLSESRAAVLEEREKARRNYELAWDEAGPEAAGDPLLVALGQARRRREAAESEIRQLLAYGREFMGPRPYRLADLAAAAGMSISGVRTAYDHADVDRVEGLIGRRSRNWRAADPDDSPAEAKS